MKNNPLISVIIPVYNVERYLSKCLNSVLAQSYTNLEIILIDDGSTDTSGKMIDEYKKKDSRIVTIHQQNSGLSAARNTGLRIMKGKYVTFVDSDDYVTNDYVEYLYSLIKKSNFKAPLAICSLMDHYENSGKNVNCGDGSERNITGKKCIEMMCYHNLVDTCAYAKLGTNELYQGFTFPEGKLFEDIGTTYQLFMKSPIVACGFKPKYYYNIRSNSIVTSGFKKNKLDMLEMTDKMANNVIKKYPDLHSAVLRRQVYARFSTLNQMLNTNNYETEKKNIVQYIKDNRKLVLNDPQTPKRDHMAYALLRFGLPLYRFGWKTYMKMKSK